MITTIHTPLVINQPEAIFFFSTWTINRSTAIRASLVINQPRPNTRRMKGMVTQWKDLTQFTILEILQANCATGART